jgi:hypothetical protein
MSEAHRVIKVWRALWKKMAVFVYCATAIRRLCLRTARRRRGRNCGLKVGSTPCNGERDIAGLAALLPLRGIASSHP